MCQWGCLGAMYHPDREHFLLIRKKNLGPSSSLAPGLPIREGPRPRAPIVNAGERIQVVRRLLPQQSTPSPHQDARKKKTNEAHHTQWDHWPP